MTTKEKYELFDKTKINEKVLGILKNMQESSKNFTDESVNSRIDSALDKLIENFRANKPEALLTLPEAKKEVKKEKEKAIKKNEGKDLSDKKDTDDKTGLPKKDTLEERKEIIKEEDETDKEARDRARKELEKEKDKAKDEVESQIEKLNRLILEDPSLRGFNTGSAATGGGRSTPIIDAERKALPRGSRVSQKGWKNQYGASDGGRKYWENRENRSDRKSPEYETGKPYLEKGGETDGKYTEYEMVVLSKDADGKAHKYRFLISARNIDEAKQTATDGWHSEFGDMGETFYKVMSDSKYRMDYGMADGGMMEDDGELNGDLYKVGFIKVYEDGEEGDTVYVKEIYGNSEEEALSKFKKIHPKHKIEFISKYADGGMMADGGEVDFEERMAKMRSAYENLNMIVKSKIAMAVGIDRAISIMENDYSIDPFDLITSAVRGGLLELDEINKDLVNEAVYEAENVTDDYRDSGQGISGSDMTAFTKNVLDGAGYKTGFINNRLERVDDEGNKLEIDKYEMNY